MITIGFTLLQPLRSRFDSPSNGNPINPRITCSSCATQKKWPLQQGFAHVFLISPLTFQVQLPKSVALRWCDFLPPLPPLASPRETRSLRVSCDSWNSHWQQLMTSESISYDLPIWWFGDLFWESTLVPLGVFLFMWNFLGKDSRMAFKAVWLCLGKAIALAQPGWNG